MNVKRVKKWGCIALALFMGVTIDSGFTAGMLTKGAIVKAEEISESMKDDSKKTLTYDNKIQSDQDTRYIVKVSRSQDFPSGYSSYIEAMSKDDTQECIDFLNKKLKDSNQEVGDFVDPMEISVSNELNETATDLGKVTVRVYMENVDGLSDYTLYHFKDDDCETVNFTTGTEDSRTVLTDYVEFSTDSFSPFIFVKTQEKAKESSEASKKDSSENDKDVSKDLEENSEQDELASTPSAISEDASTDTSSPTIYFRTFKTSLFKGATQNTDGTYTWTPSSPTKGHRFAYRISYSISGVDVAKAGQIKMTIPKSIIVDRNGKSGDSYEMSIPEKAEVDAYLSGVNQDIDEDVNYAYYEDGDNIVIYNFREVPAGDNGYIEMAYYTTETTFNYVDEKDFDFTCSGEITSDNGDKSEVVADKVTANIDTKAEIISTEKQYPEKYTSWKSSWGNGIKPENDSEYVYLVWRIDSVIDATQAYDFSLEDTLTGQTDEMTKAMSVIGYKFEGGSWQASNKVKNQTLYSNNNEVARYDYVLTSIKKSKLNELEYWKAINNIKSTVTPVDGEEETSAKATRTWTWQKPVFTAPTGAFYAYKRADGAYRANDPYSIFSNVTHYAKDKSIKAGDYSRYDLENFNGYDDTKKTLTEYNNLDYASWIVGYGYPWTYDYDNYSTDGKDPEGYGKVNVDYELKDTGIYLFDASEPQATAPKTDVLTSDDFCYYQLDYSFYFKEAVWNEEEQKFDSTSKDITFQDDEIVSFYGKFGKSDKSVLFATHNLKTGEVWFDSTYVDSIQDGHIYFKDGADLVEYTLKTSNTHYYTELYTVPFAKLKNSKTVMAFVEGKSDIGITNTNKGYVYSENYEHSTYSIEEEDKGTKNLIFSHSESDTDYVRTTKRDSALTKSIASVSNNTKKKAYLITWSVKAEETTTVSTEETIPIPQETGTIFDLLPKGATVDKDSIRVYNGSKYLSATEYTIKMIENYKNSGRSMLVVKMSSGGDYYKLTYDTLYSWESITDYGDNVYNAVAYKTGNDEISDGFVDNGGTEYSNGDKNPNAIKDASLMSELDEIDSDNKTGDNRKYIYAEEDFDVSALTAASSGLKKKVKEERDDDWSYSTMTKIDGNYAYRLRYQSSNSSSSKDMIFFDSLENYDKDTMRDYGNDSDWRGTLQSIDTSQLEEKGIKPVIYISTVEKLDIEENHNLKDSSVWTKVTKDTDLSTAKAVAIDMRKTVDGEDYVLSQGESVVAYLYMKAPNYAPEAKDGASLPYAYNNIYISNTIQDEDEKSSENFLIHQDYTKISLTVSGSFGLRKISSESSAITIADTSFKLYGTSSYGTEYNQTLTTNKNGEIYFEDVEMGQYILKEQSTTDDWLLDNTEHQVLIDNTGKAYVDGEDYTNKYVFIENNPRVHADISFKKADITNTYKKLADSQFRLSGVSDYGTNLFMYAKSNSTGTVSFKNIEKGAYELSETKATDGYTLNQNVYEVKVDENGNVSISFKNQVGPTKIDVINSNGTYVIGNEPLHTVYFYKSSSWDNEALELAKFSLKGTSDFGTNVDMEAYSDKNGRVEFTGLESGIYTLEETSAPDGYMVNNNKYTVEVKTIQEGQSGDEITIDGLSTNDAILDGKVPVFYDAPKDGKLTITKEWDDGEEDRNPSELNVTVTTNKPINYYASHTITFDANGGNFGETVSTNQVSYGVSETGEIVSVLNGSVLLPSKDGCRFDYWNKSSSAKSYWTTKKDGTGDKYYSLESDPYNVIDKDGNIITLKDDITLYAHYQELSYTFQNTQSENNCFFANYTYGAGLVEHVVFTDEVAPNNVEKKDVTDVKDGSVVSWIEKYVEDNKNCITVYVSSQKKGQPIYAAVNNSYLFSNSYFCRNIKTIDLKNLDTSKNRCMEGMFSGCSSLTELDLSNFNTSNVADMSKMFANCSSLTDLDVSNFDTSNVTNMQGMFSGCSSLIELDLSNFNTSKITNTSSMFANCSSLTDLDVSNFDTSNVTNMQGMFSGCSSLTELDLSNFNTSKITDMSYMFGVKTNNGCSSLTELDVSNFDTSNVTNMQGMFSGCSSLIELDLSNFNTSKVTDMSYMFGYNASRNGCSSLTELDVSNFDTSNVINMSSMFANCYSLTELDLSNFNTSKVTDMSYMFHMLLGGSLASLNVSNFDTSKVTNMSSMFLGCSILADLDVSNFDTSKVTNMQGMFAKCNSLTELDLSNFNTSKVTNMSSMFANCSSSTDLDVSNFDTSNVTNMQGMFIGCSSLTELDLSNFNTSKITNMSEMFYNDTKLETILINSEWDVENVSTSDKMFQSCYNLHNFNADYIDKTKAYAGDYGYLTIHPDYLVAYSVRFEKNLSTATGTMSDESFNAGESKALTSNNFSDLSGIYAFNGWNTKADGTGKSYSNEQTVQYLTKNSSITLYAQWRNTSETYSHTSNINDTGNASSVYSSSQKTTDTITLDGATKLKVEIWYSTENISWDWVELRDSSGTILTTDANGTTIGSSGKLGGGRLTSKPSDDSDYHKIFYIDGDTVQFYFQSDSSSEYYGYYAIVTKVE